MIVNVRGTSGAGKSTLVRAIMSYYPDKMAHFIEKRKQPIGYTLHKLNSKPLYIVGHYETACGGGDTVKTLDQIFGYVKQAHADNMNVMFEGMLLCSDHKRITALAQETGETVILSLTTPVDECCDNIRKRRAAKGNEKELNEKNTRTRFDYEQKLIVKLKEAGVDLRLLNYAEAFDTVKGLFGL